MKSQITSIESLKSVSSLLLFRLKVYYLYEASKSGQTTKTALTSLDFYPKLEALYKGHLRKTRSDAIIGIAPSGIKFNFPIQGKNI